MVYAGGAVSPRHSGSKKLWPSAPTAAGRSRRRPGGRVGEDCPSGEEQGATGERKSNLLSPLALETSVCVCVCFTLWCYKNYSQGSPSSRGQIKETDLSPEFWRKPPTHEKQLLPDRQRTLLTQWREDWLYVSRSDLLLGLSHQGATIRRDEASGAVIVARIMRGGAADRSGKTSSVHKTEIIMQMTVSWLQRSTARKKFDCSSRITSVPFICWSPTNRTFLSLPTYWQRSEEIMLCNPTHRLQRSNAWD